MLTKTGSKPITVSAIAKKLGVSSRTVLRDMPAIEAWFEENNITFVRKPGVGLMLQEKPRTIRQIQELLDTERVKPAYSQRERRRQLLGELLCAREPVKSYVFISRFHISGGTLSRDLDALNDWLSACGIQVIRRPVWASCWRAASLAAAKTLPTPLPGARTRGKQFSSCGRIPCRTVALIRKQIFKVIQP